MVARQNLNPDLGAVLKRLKANVEKSSTTPNGINVVEEGGAIEIYDPVTGVLGVRLAPGDSIFTGRVTVQAGSSIPSSVIPGLDTTTAKVNAVTTTEDGFTVIDGGQILTNSISTWALNATEMAAEYITAGNLTAGVLNVTGRFSTDTAGYPSLVIQPSQTSWNGKDLAIWWTADGGTPGFGNEAGTVAGLWMTAQPTLSSQLPLNIRGQSNAGIVVWGTSVVVRPTGGSTSSSITGFADRNFDIKSYSDSMYSATGDLFITADEIRLNSTGSAKPVRIESDIALTGKIYGADGTAPVMSARGMTFDPVSGFIPLIYGANTMRVESGTYLDLKGQSGVRIMTGVDPFRLTDYGEGYKFTATQSANMVMGATDGKVYRSTSNSKYKKEITEHPLNEAYLALPTYEWTDLGADQEMKARGLDKRVKPNKPEDVGVWLTARRRIVGTLADEAYKVVPELVVLDADGVPDAYEYDRDGAMLRPFVKNLWDNDKVQDSAIADLVRRVTNLERRPQNPDK